jgi:SAM-dependent methyltransferase
VRLSDNTDRSWTVHGRKDPYFGVFADPKFRGKNLTAESIKELMDSGERHIAAMVALAEEYFGPIKRGSALDFGCGVGRVLLPLACRFASATGIDVSPAMLDEAKKHAISVGQSNVSFVLSSNDLASLSGSFDLIHSMLVFQHIPTARGEQLLVSLARHLAPDGVAILHLNLRMNRPRWRHFASLLRRHVSVLNVPANLLAGRPWNEPMVQMNEYSIDRIITALAREGIPTMVLHTFDNQQTTQAYLMFQMRRK